MTWLTWRLQRTELVLLGVMILVLGGLLLRTHADVVTLSRSLTPNECPVPLPGPEQGCLIELSWLYRLVSGGLGGLNFLPLIAALLLALPIVVEFENGTYRLAWTQGVTRGYWVRTKFGILNLCGVAFAALFALMFRWWNSPMDQVSERFSLSRYDLRGTLPVGLTLFAIGLTLAVGTVLRRPIPAFVLASVAFVAVRAPFMLWIRPRLISPLTRTEAEYQEAHAGFGNWWLSTHWQDAAGKRLSESQYSDLCYPTGVYVTRQMHEQCIADNGLVRFITFHPASHFWPLQLVETSIFLAAGMALIGFAAWYVLRRIE